MPLTFDLEEQSDVLIKLSEAQEAHELVHDWLLEVGLDAERALNESCVENLHLLLRIECILIHLDCEWVLVCVVV